MTTPTCLYSLIEIYNINGEDYRSYMFVETENDDARKTLVDICARYNHYDSFGVDDKFDDIMEEDVKLSQKFFTAAHIESFKDVESHTDGRGMCVFAISKEDADFDTLKSVLSNAVSGASTLPTMGSWSRNRWRHSFVYNGWIRSSDDYVKYG